MSRNVIGDVTEFGAWTRNFHLQRKRAFRSSKKYLIIKKLRELPCRQMERAYGMQLATNPI
jgi:hypothetical protein